MPLESRPLGRLSCFPPPNKKVGSPVGTLPEIYSNSLKKQKRTESLGNFQGVVFCCPPFDFGSKISENWIGRDDRPDQNAACDLEGGDSLTVLTIFGADYFQGSVNLLKHV
jgi:hypothetical protein